VGIKLANDNQIHIIHVLHSHLELHAIDTAKPLCPFSGCERTTSFSVLADSCIDQPAIASGSQRLESNKTQTL